MKVPVPTQRRSTPLEVKKLQKLNKNSQNILIGLGAGPKSWIVKGNFECEYTKRNSRIRLKHPNPTESGSTKLN